MSSCLSPGNDLPVRYLRLLAPPLQLLSAAVWQVVQRGLVDHYGMLEEFVTMVTELVPELMSYSQRAQLILGLRARVSRGLFIYLFIFSWLMMHNKYCIYVADAVFKESIKSASTWFFVLYLYS